MQRRVPRSAIGLVVAVAISAIGPGTLPGTAQAQVDATVPTVAAAPTTTVPALSPAQYTAIALDFIEARAYKRSSIDWAAARARAEQRAAAAVTISDTYPIISDTLRGLNDRHSSFTSPPQAVKQTAGKSTGFGFIAVSDGRVVTITEGGPAANAGLRVGDVIRLLDGQPFKASNGTLVLQRDRNGQLPTSITLTWTRKGVRKPFVKQVTIGEITLVSTPKAAPVPAPGGTSFGRLGYLDVPGIVGDAAAQKTFATQLQAAIAELQSSADRCGWIVDLRRNRGGYIYAMLTGLGPLLETSPGGAPIGGQRGARGEEFLWRYVNGATVVNASPTIAVDAPVRLPRTDVPVAVLTSRLTASAGEAVTISFRGRPNTRSFGEVTNGLTTFTERKPMPDGAFLDVMSQVDIDRLGVAYEGPVPVDEPIVLDWGNLANDKDPALAAAANWLNAQAACVP